MENRERYTVTYTVDGDRPDERSATVGRIRAVVATLQREAFPIAFLGATQVLDGTGRPVTVTARYEASTKGIVGLLNWRARLPACGSPRRIDGEPTASDPEPAGVAGRTSD